MKYIEQLATQFRKAIDMALEAGEFDNDSIYRRFPRACCGDTSDLLAQYLLDKGIKTDYVCGMYWGKTDGNGQFHAWLMVDKCIIIDITGDQFSGRSTFLNYDKSVYVGEGDDFHGRKMTAERISLEIIRLPIQHNADRTPYIDPNRTYSDYGYVPDWQFMEDYMKALPYGDRL